MRALLFGVEPESDGSDLPADTPPLLRALATTPMGLRDLEDPDLPADDWVLLRTRMCGICGSDSKQVFLDGEPDNAMTAVISFPHVLGHELVASVERGGPRAALSAGTRVVLNPWLSCAPRGIDPPCGACAAGDLSLCAHFTDGHLTPGIHVGNSSQAPGGFGELLPAHASMCIPVPDDLPDEVAVLADPFSVSLHAVVRNPPPPGGRALVYGAGALGVTTCAVLRALHPDVEVAAVARFDGQAEAAAAQGARVLRSEPPEAIVMAVAEWTGGVVRTPFLGLPWLHPGGADVVYDTVGSPATLEVGVRAVRARGTIVITGVATPGRFEWTPWYFKELRLVGSNAFGIEEVEGRRQHAMAHYFELVGQGRVDVAAMLTHTFRLDEWREAFRTIALQGETGAVKVAFDLR
jgi:threonine dehydrogenase-like Zn-dependent dehydrogenase